MTTPAAAGLTMPPEWAPHERTFMAWPCRRELWGGQLAAAKVESAGLRLGCSRHCSVVISVPSPSTPMEPPSSTSGAR